MIMTWNSMTGKAAGKAAGMRTAVVIGLALLLLAVLFPATTASMDLVRPLLGVPVGKVVGLGFVAMAYGVLFAPFCLVDGADCFGVRDAGTAGDSQFYRSCALHLHTVLGLTHTHRPWPRPGPARHTGSLSRPAAWRE